MRPAVARCYTVSRKQASGRSCNVGRARTQPVCGARSRVNRDLVGRGVAMSVSEYEELVRDVVVELQTRKVPAGLRDEKGFEQQFVEPVCTDILRPQLCVATHPWGDPTKAECWRRSKSWGAVEAWGLKHTFDLVARSREGADSEPSWRLAVEVKLSKMRGGTKPTGEFQRMMGQCILARLRHDAVVGVFGYAGDLEGADADEPHFARLRDDYAIWVVTRQVRLAA